MANAEGLDRFQCQTCEAIEDFVYVCDRKHLMCEQCYDKLETKPALCKCENLLHSRQCNPLSQNIREVCKFHANGCTWDFAAGEMDSHLLECRYRPYKCIGATLNVWTCDWTGTQIELEAHIKNDHPQIGTMLKHSEKLSLPFDADTDAGTLNLISAFSRRFVFYSHMNNDTRMVYFCIFLLGKKSEAARYFIDFAIMGNTNEKIEYKMSCPSDVEDIRAIVADERFVAISYRSLAKYLDEDNNINLQFYVNQKRPAVLGELNTNAGEMGKDSNGKAVAKVTKPVLGHPVKKGPIKPVNMTKKPPAAGPSPSGGVSKPPVSDPNWRAKGRNTLEMTSVAGALVGKSHQHNLSSVETVPDCFSAAKSSSTKKSLQMFQQPYKGVDQKYYKVKYPTCSIQKPEYKK